MLFDAVVCIMAFRNLPSTNQILDLSEAADTCFSGDHVRTIGILKSYDYTSSLAMVSMTANSLALNHATHENKEFQLWVDLSLVEPVPDGVRLQALCEFLGEMDTQSEGSAERPILRVRCVRCVHGLDTRQYYKSIRNRNQYLQNCNNRPIT